MEEYGHLADSRELAACVEIDPLTGAPRCGPYCNFSFVGAPLCIAPTYGQASTVSLIGYDGSGNNGSNWGGGRLNYYCQVFDHAYGAAAVATTVIHEKFHSIELDGHVDCHLGPGRCADAWDFEIPTSPRQYNELALFRHVEPYQIGYRYLCDLVEAPADWIPVMSQVVHNEYANKLQEEARYSNLTPPPSTTGTPLDAGQAPYSCGLPDAILGLVVGSACSTGGTRCNVDADCATGEECNSLCCELEEILR